MLMSTVSSEQLPALLPALCTLLRDAVEGGASIGFMLPLSIEEAAAYWLGVKADIANPGCRLWVAQDGENIVGTVQLSLCMRKNGLHRAEVQKLMVAQSARRQGIAAQLMQALEQYARQEKRHLLFLDTEQGSPAEIFYQRLGYQLAGNIPEFASSPQGGLKATALYFKLLGS
jgi:acetyltransferase